MYLANNEICSIKKVNGLKNLPKLIILDLKGNKINFEKYYRLYIIFSLKNIKVLDGSNIDEK